MRHEVIMPALGMAQDTGLVVSWGKSPGDAISADDVLLEVETDKSTMEVPAGHDGYLAEVLAAAGEDVPVGVTIAIITTEKPAQTVNRRYDEGGTSEPAPAPPNEPEVETQEPRTIAKSAPETALPSLPSGRILASPKARRLAQSEGLDLSRLVAAGHRQPYHVKDLETLRAQATPPPSAGASIRLEARVSHERLSSLCDWMARGTDAPVDIAAILAGMAAASFGTGDESPDIVIAVERFGRSQIFGNRIGPWLDIEPIEDVLAPTLIVRDLRHSSLTHISLGAETAPVISLTEDDQRIAITLECATDQLDGARALSLVTAFADRLADPLRHML